MKLLVRAAMGLVALAAFILSFETLTNLAQLAGYGSLAWLYPVCIDLGTVSSCAAWMATRSRQAFHLTWSLLAASILLNGCEHWLQAAGQRPEWWLITVIAMAPPAILGVVTHLAVGLGEPGRPVPRGKSAGPSPQVCVTQVTPDPDGVSQAGDVRGCDPVAELIAQGVGRRKVAAELGITEYAAKQLIAASRNGAAR